MKILLVTNSNIINKIFTLIASKLELKLVVINDLNSISKSDIIILDDSIENINNIDYSEYSNKIGIISNNINNNFSFSIPKPFLPSQLNSIIFNEVNKKEEDMVSIDDISFDNRDESIISSSDIQTGGILNNSDIVEIKSILNKDKPIIDNVDNEYINELSDIIDNVIEELNTQER